MDTNLRSTNLHVTSRNFQFNNTLKQHLPYRLNNYIMKLYYSPFNLQHNPGIIFSKYRSQSIDRVYNFFKYFRN